MDQRQGQRHSKSNDRMGADVRRRGFFFGFDTVRAATCSLEGSVEDVSQN